MSTSEPTFTPNPAIEHLEPLIGEWRVHVPDEGDEIDAGRVSFEWLDDGAFVKYRSQSPAPYPSGVVIIGCDDTTGRCAALYSDSRGVARLYGMSLSDGVWRQWREAPGFSQRFAGRFGDDGDTISGTWELCEDGETWRRDFDVVYRRVSA